MANERKPLTGKRRHDIAWIWITHLLHHFLWPAGPHHECCACRPWPLQQCLSSSSYVYAV